MLRLALPVLLAVGLAGCFDDGIPATIIGKDCQALGDSKVRIEPEGLSIKPWIGLPFEKCNIVNSGNYVVYYPDSGRTSIYQAEGGPCIWDTKNGPAGC